MIDIHSILYKDIAKPLHDLVFNSRFIPEYESGQALYDQEQGSFFLYLEPSDGRVYLT